MNVTVEIKRRESLADVKTVEVKENAEEEFETGRFSSRPSRQA